MISYNLHCHMMMPSLEQKYLKGQPINAFNCLQI